MKRLQFLLIAFLSVSAGCHSINTGYEFGPLLPFDTSICEHGSNCDRCDKYSTNPRDALPTRLCDRMGNNFVSQKLAEHRESKGLPPWPRFHPLPTRPVFYPEQMDDIPLEPEMLGSFQAVNLKNSVPATVVRP